MNRVEYDSENRFCPICRQERKDILQHLRINHDIENREQLVKKLNQEKIKKKKQEAFAEYVDELKKRIENGKITYEEYRHLVSQWNKESNHEQ